MPTVPAPVLPERSLNPISGERFRAPDIGAGGRIIGAGLGNLGGALAGAAQDQKEIDAIYAEAEAKKLDNEYQEFERETLFGDSGFYRNQNDDAINARAPTEEAINQKIAELTARATHPEARRMLETVLDRRKNQTFNGLASYSQGQARNFAISQANARIGNAQEAYVTFRDDPERAAANRATILSEVRRLADLEGWNDNDILVAKEQEAISGMHAAVVQAELLNDPTKALSYFERWKHEISPAQELQLEAQMRPVLVEHDARGFAEMAEQFASPVAQPIEVPTEGDAPGTTTTNMSTGDVWGRMIHTESRGRQTVGGQPVTSSAGAIGIAQVMPDTARQMADELGLPWDENRYKTDAAYNMRLGQAYFAKMLRMFGGDVTKAVAAYNAGPGHPMRGRAGVRGAMRAAREAGSADWTAFLPRETRGYLQSVLGDNRDARGVSTSSPTTSSLDAQLEWAETFIPERLAGKPPRYIEEVVDATKARIRQQYAERERAVAAENEALYEQALEHVFALGDNFTSITQIPGYQNLPPDRRLQLDGMARQNAAQTAKPQTDWTFYAELQTMTPRELRDVPVAEARRRLGDEEFQEFARERGKTTPPAKALTYDNILSYTRMSLQAAGFALGDSQAGREDAPVVNEFLRRMNQWARSVFEQTSKWPDADAVRRQGDRFLIEGSWKKDGNWVHGRAFASEGGFDPDIPADIERTIRRALGPTATPRQISEAYIAGKGIDW